MIFEKNSVFRKLDGEHLRILWAHASEEMLWAISIEDSLALPELLSRSKLVESYVNRELTLVEDTWLNTLRRETDLSEAEINVRDKAWGVIAPLVQFQPNIYFCSIRAKLVYEVCQATGITRQTVYVYLRRFWQLGCVPMALVPNYRKCGGKGKPRKISELKRGRKRSISPGKGMNVTDFVLKQIRIASSKKFLSSRRSSLRTAYEWMLGNCFPEAVKIIKTVSGRNKVEIVDPDRVPTFEQFKYYFHKENNLVAVVLSRKGSRAFEKEFRALLDSSLNEVEGPGTRYQIDATIVDIYLVSRFDRNKIVGRPTLYILIDVFSRMIVGCYVGLEAPSWLCATMAILNAVEDKVEFCKRYGIDITSDEWPVAELSLKVLGDNGEMESTIANKLVSNFGIDLENAAPYRGDAKGVVERTFKTVHAEFGPYTPGFVEPDYRERGARDYRLDAKLTIEEITRIILCSIMKINATDRRDYQCHPQAVKANIPYAPIQLWQWGKENLRADVRPFDYDYTKYHLLPDSKITITRKGLRFMKGLYYASKEMMLEPWFLSVQEKKLTLTAAYHPGDMSRVFVWSPYDKDVVYTAELAAHCHVFKGKSLVEIGALRRKEREINAHYKKDLTELRIGFQKDIEDIVNQAIKESDDQYDPTLSASERTRNIKKNKAQELQAMMGHTLKRIGIDPGANLVFDESLDSTDDVDEANAAEFIAKYRKIGDSGA